MRPLTEASAATLLAHRWREHALDVRLRRLLDAQAIKEAKYRATAEREADEAAYAYSLPGASSRIWRILREAALVMLATVVLVIYAPDAYSSVLPILAVEGGTAAEQLCRALIGGAVLVAAFALLFLTLLALYVGQWLRGFYLLHSVWIGGLLAVPTFLLLVRVCEAFRLPLDVVSAGLVTWNLAVPAAVVVHWADTERQFRTLRRLYAAAISALASWLLVSLPWQTALAALVELALLDVVLVLAPSSPVQKLDQLHRARRRAGEPEMPGLVYKADGLELGMGDFIVFSALGGYTARCRVSSLAVAFLGVLAGLIPTMLHLALARRRTVVPALPLSIAVSCVLLALEGLLVLPLADKLASGAVSL